MWSNEWFAEFPMFFSSHYHILPCQCRYLSSSGLPPRPSLSNLFTDLIAVQWRFLEFLLPPHLSLLLSSYSSRSLSLFLSFPCLHKFLYFQRRRCGRHRRRRHPIVFAAVFSAPVVLWPMKGLDLSYRGTGEPMRRKNPGRRVSMTSRSGISTNQRSSRYWKS